MCGKFKKRSISKISFNNSAKYLAVKYSNSITVKLAFDEYQQKINYREKYMKGWPLSLSEALNHSG